jgi:hypothetical protein
MGGDDEAGKFHQQRGEYRERARGVQRKSRGAKPPLAIWDGSTRLRRVRGRLEILLGLGLLLTAGPAAGAPGLVTNAAVARCLERLDEVVVEVDALVTAATNEVARAACLAERVNGVRSLRELARTLHAAVEAHDEAEDAPEVLAANQSKILLACERAEKLLAEMRGCGAATGPVKKPRRVVAQYGPAAPARTRARGSRTPVRDATTCLRQSRLAGLVWEALEKDATADDRARMETLAGEGIAPAGGWQVDDCVTVDDVCRVACQMLGMNVENATDPYQYVLAARREGLGVDELLPRRRREAEPPLVWESEARAFFAYGLAAPLPGSRRIQPD